MVCRLHRLVNCTNRCKNFAQICHIKIGLKAAQLRGVSACFCSNFTFVATNLFQEHPQFLLAAGSLSYSQPTFNLWFNCLDGAKTRRNAVYTAQHVDTSTTSLASTVWRTRPDNKNITILAQKVPGQKDMFAPVLSGVPGQTTRCPCGFGAYDRTSLATAGRITVDLLVSFSFYGVSRNLSVAMQI